MLRKLANRVEPLSAAATGQTAYERFSLDPGLTALAVVDAEQRPIGIITRSKFFLRFGDTWGRPLFERRPVTKLMEPDALIAEADVAIAELAPRVADRDGAVMEGFIVTDQGRYVGVGCGQDVFRCILRENQETLERTQRLNAELDRLLQLRSAGKGSLQALVREVTRTAALELGVERASVWVMDAERTALRCLDLFENDRHGGCAPLRADQYPKYFEALCSRRALAIEDAQNHSDTCEFAEPYLKPLGIVSMLDAQIYSGAEVIGALCCETRARRRWRPEEISFCASVAQVLSLVMLADALDEERRSLEERVEERTADLQAALVEADAASRAKTQFLANMSHELRTPLNAIIGYSELLLESAEEDGRSHDEGDLKRVLGASKRLLGLINGVLDMAKVETGKMEVDPEVCDAEQIAKDAVDQMRYAAEANGVLLSLEAPANLPPLYSDSFKIGQCLLNLLSNAIKFTRDGAVTVRVRADGERLFYEVADTGIGMSEDQMQRLFQPFVQADASMTRRFGGTGLGLAITKRIANLLGGDVAVCSSPGVGSVFTLSLALRCAPPTKAYAA